MAILNDAGQQVFYACDDLIADIREDITHLRRTKKVEAACRIRSGVKIIFDYALDQEEEKRFHLSEYEWLESMTLGQLLAYALRQNRPTVSPGPFDSVSDLYDASGLSISAFSGTLGIPLRTVQDWIYDKRQCPDYVLDLMAYKLEHEHKI